MKTFFLTSTIEIEAEDREQADRRLTLAQSHNGDIFQEIDIIYDLLRNAQINNNEI